MSKCIFKRGVPSITWMTNEGFYLNNRDPRVKCKVVISRPKTQKIWRSYFSLDQQSSKYSNLFIIGICYLHGTFMAISKKAIYTFPV